MCQASRRVGAVPAVSPTFAAGAPVAAPAGRPAVPGAGCVVDRNLTSLDPLLCADETVQLRCDLHYGSFAVTQRRVVSIAHPDSFLASLLWPNFEWLAGMHDRRAVSFYAYRKFFHPERLFVGVVTGLVALASLVAVILGGTGRAIHPAELGVVVLVGLVMAVVSLVFLRYSRMGAVIVLSDAGVSRVRVRAGERDEAVRFVAAAAATLGVA